MRRAGAQADPEFELGIEESKGLEAFRGDGTSCHSAGFNLSTEHFTPVPAGN